MTYKIYKTLHYVNIGLLISLISITVYDTIYLHLYNSGSLIAVLFCCIVLCVILRYMKVLQSIEIIYHNNKEEIHIKKLMILFSILMIMTAFIFTLGLYGIYTRILYDNGGYAIFG
ncbi:hypothetical protein XF24_00072 [candidate division SR1 bacterium Aalborg_AAW-1]|nr:hypothetical protein XF24_00072 [candidate division SR1 bacterium Aalborg_AAW-1]